MSQIKFCESCGEYTENDWGRCSQCNELFEKKPKKEKYDEWEENNDEWGTDDEAEEFGDIVKRGGD